MRPATCFLAALVALTGCSESNSPADAGVDSGDPGADASTDSATRDSSTPDGGLPDSTDSGEPDAGPLLCGNGAIDDAEGCDDTNDDDGDGCSSSCMIEPGYVCPEVGAPCSAAECGDGVRAGAEECDDGNRLISDGCSFFCRVEPAWVCDTDACRLAICGDGSVEADETCDDNNRVAGDGCDAECALESGYACEAPGEPCVVIECGDGIVQGLEECDDNGVIAGDGCSATCALEVGFDCPDPGVPCVAILCGDGVVQGLEECDDGNAVASDGCSSCGVDPFSQCEGEPSVCRPLLQYALVREFPTPFPATQAIHYDPSSRTFTIYGFFEVDGDGIEICADGTVVGARPRPVGDRLDGATYDPVFDRFLFIQQTCVMTEVDRAGATVRSVTLPGCTSAAGIAVGDSGRLYIADYLAQRILTYDRLGTELIDTLSTPVASRFLDNVFSLSGLDLFGTVGFPGASLTVRAFNADGAPYGNSTLPGPMFSSGGGAAFPGSIDGVESATDGLGLLFCPEYTGSCQLFSLRCETDSDCSSRVPGTACNLGIDEPYCFLPGEARNDSYTLPRSTPSNLDVTRNDLGSEASCSETLPTVVGVSEGSEGGSIAIGADGTSVDYVPAVGFCGVETFTYRIDSERRATAIVRVDVLCECGDGVMEGTEECDDDNLEDNDGCSSECTLECGDTIVQPSEQCDDGNRVGGDGCSALCRTEVS